MASLPDPVLLVLPDDTDALGERLAASTADYLSTISGRDVEPLRLADDDFDALPGPVFVKGFLRCCTRALGLPSETVMELLYERERAALQARRHQQRPLLPPPSGPEVEIASQAPKLPNRIKDRPAPDGGVARRALLGLPRANTLLWLVIAAFVAVLVMAAFNLAGDSPVGPHT
ncbi:MAG: helix-turn-helix domain-containing protein [Myxococcales bacterium]|nr:helix-turn-helix domain-containing protein [Myxococcales bacterium]